MNFDDEDGVESFDDLQKIIERADDIVLNSLPKRSKEKYVIAYAKFVQWRSEHKIEQKDMCEEVMLVYLNKLYEEEKLKPLTIWSRYSMLKRTLLAYESLSIKPWDKVNSFMKRLAKGYRTKKVMVFTADDITNFSSQAPDDMYLVEKVSLKMNKIYNKNKSLKIKMCKNLLDSLKISCMRLIFLNYWKFVKILRFLKLLEYIPRISILLYIYQK